MGEEALAWCGGCYAGSGGATYSVITQFSKHRREPPSRKKKKNNPEMAPHFSSDENVPANTTAVAIDKDKNSPQAVRWAIDHLVITNPFIVLIHVRHKNRRYPFSRFSYY